MGKKRKKFDPWQIPAFVAFCKEATGEEYSWEGWGLVIRHLRTAHSMDQEMFGRVLRGYTQSQISRYESEQAEPPIDFWIKIARAFGVNTVWAITGEGLPYIEQFIQSEERKRMIRWWQWKEDGSEIMRDIRGL